MFTHVMVGSNDLQRAKVFYDAVFGALGAAQGFTDPKGRLIYVHNGARFLVTTPINGEPASVSNGATVGFAMDSPEQAREWHAAGVSNGGASIEDPPGEREGMYGPIYLAYLRDPDGNKLCALFRPLASNPK